MRKGVRVSYRLRERPIRGELGTTLQDHCRSTAAPVVLVRGAMGAGKSRFLRLGLAGLEDREMIVLDQRPAPDRTGVSEPEPGKHRLSLLNETPEDGRGNGPNPYAAFTGLLASFHGSWGSAPPVVVVENVDVLDSPSLTVIDLLIRSQRAGVLLTASSSAVVLRFAQVLQSARGLELILAPLTASEVSELARQEYGVPASEPVARYLRHTSGGSALLVADMLRLGFEERWLVPVDGYVVFNGLPALLDGYVAKESVARLRAEAGSDLVEFCYLVALHGELELGEAMSSRASGTNLLLAEELGLVTIERGRVRLRAQALAYFLQLAIRGWDESAVGRQAQWRSHSDPAHRSVFAAVQAGIDCSREELLASARRWLDRGVLARAEAMLDAIDGPGADDRAVLLRAELAAVAGRPYTALETLRAVCGQQTREAFELSARIKIVLLGDIAAAEDTFAQLAALERDGIVPPASEADAYRRYALQVQRDWVSLPPGEVLAAHDPPAPPPPGTGHEPGIAAARLRIMAAVAHARAYGGDPRAAAELVQAMAVPPQPPRDVQAVPLLDQLWLRTVLQGTLMAAGIHPDELSAVPWYATPDERIVPDLCAMEAAGLYVDLVNGTPVPALAERLAQLQAQVSTHVPLQRHIRPHLEVISAVVTALGERPAPGVAPDPSCTGDGTESRAVQGVREMRPDAYDPYARHVLLLGQALLTPPGDLAEVLTRSRRDFAPAPGGHHIILRCVAVRRMAELPEHALRMLAQELSGTDADDDLVRALTALADLRAGGAGRAPRPALERALGELIEKRPALDPRGLALTLAALGLEQGPAADRLLRNSPAAEEWLRSGTEPEPERAPRREDLRTVLTAREYQVAELAAGGLSNAAIAERLSISRRTAETHLGHAYRKLGIASRQELWAEFLA
ncbi:helix-turn-helix transcriptional regulator [Sediminivirga luteola]|uniref:helix-turn-helix transcriptional regulator n=1 Tax=Sediminivirga luteola TaxID=1774748 RepID=UPI001F5755CC|nr:helix-turn-helix transcriptional regulator [Sediminivirga luteola]